MSASNHKNFNLPWHQYDQYWIGVRSKSGTIPAELQQPLKASGLQAIGSIMGMKTGRDWKKIWDAIYPSLSSAPHEIEVTVIQNASQLPANPAHADWKAPVAIQSVSDSMWLGDALMNDKILCYLQPVV